MSNKTLGLGLLAVAVAIIAGFGILQLTGNEEAEETPAVSLESSTTPAAEPEAATNPETFTLAEVATHNSENDCWTIIDENVYDITTYVPRHPGGDEILRACGANGSSLFNERTTDDGETVGSGTPHSSSAQSQLSSLLVGSLE